jgi:hypothetical protein
MVTVDGAVVAVVVAGVLVMVVVTVTVEGVVVTVVFPGVTVAAAVAVAGGKVTVAVTGATGAGEAVLISDSGFSHPGIFFHPYCFMQAQNSWEEALSLSPA